MEEHELEMFELRQERLLRRGGNERRSIVATKREDIMTFTPTEDEESDHE